MKKREATHQHRLDPRSSINASGRERRDANRSPERSERRSRETVRPISTLRARTRSKLRCRSRSTRSAAASPPREIAMKHQETHSGSGRFIDTACPFDANGYCVMHPGVRMAKKKHGGGWKIKLRQCPRCYDSSDRRKNSGDTEPMMSEDSRHGDRYHNRNASGRGRSAGQNSSVRSRTPPAKSHQQSRGRTTTHERGRIRSHGDNNRNSHRPRPPNSHMADCERDDQCGEPRRRSRRRPSRSHRRDDGERRRHRRPTTTPFDKRGQCHAHPHVKLASKKMLGGWKIHMKLCPLCSLLHRDEDDGRTTAAGDRSAGSGTSRLSDGSGHSRRGRASSSRGRFYRRRSVGSSARASPSRGRFCRRRSVGSSARASSPGSLGSGAASLPSAGSARSGRSTCSRSTGLSSKKRAKKKGGKDDSFLPLDEDGFCLRHPDVRLARMSKKGGLRILMDFCPECARGSPIVGGSVGGGKTWVRKCSITSAHSSCISRQSGKSDGSHSTFMEGMPYIDCDGDSGHYTGHVDDLGQPTGRGKMKYISGSKFDGVWHEGTKLHGRTSKKRGPKHERAPRQNTPPPPPPPRLPTEKLPGKGGPKPSRHYTVNAGGDPKSIGHRCSHRDMPPRDREEEEGSTPSAGRPEPSLSRLSRKCDEIELLLKEL